MTLGSLMLIDVNQAPEILEAVSLKVILPIVTHETGQKGAFTMAGDYFYYEGANGIIYQVPVNAPASAKKVYELPDMSYKSIANYDYFTSLKTENGKAFLSYHTGGATMGSDHLIWLKDDGTYEVLDSGYSLMKIYDNYTVRVEQRGPFFAENLQIKKNGEKDYVNVGKSNFSYGMYIYKDVYNNSRAATPSKDLYLIGDEIYVLGYYGYFLENTDDQTTGIYRVNINSNEQARLCDNEVTSFKILDDTIFFADQNNFIYKVPLAGGKAERLVDEAVNSYEVLEGKLYYPKMPHPAHLQKNNP